MIHSEADVLPLLRGMAVLATVIGTLANGFLDLR